MGEEREGEMVGERWRRKGEEKSGTDNMRVSKTVQCVTNQKYTH